MNRHTTAMYILSVLFTLLGSVSFAQGNSSEFESHLASELREAEQSIIEIFNANNSSNQHNILCRNIESPGAEVAHNVCAPVFMLQSFDDYGEFLAADFHILRESFTWSEDMGEEMRNFWTDFTDLLFKSNDFTYAVVRFGKLVESREEFIASVGSI